MFKSVILLFIFIALATARNVKFSLIALNAKSVKVKIGSSSYDLTRINSYTPVYTKTIKVSDTALTYTYYVDNKSEGFSRTLAKGATTTHNEFFGRKDTVKELPQLSQVDEWTKSVGKGELFDDSYIPTVHIYGERSNKIFTTEKAASDYLERIVFILKDSIYTFKNIPAYPKNKSWNKFQFRVVLNKNGIEGRYALKFRDNNEDPTFLRQSLYGDIMNAIGNPTIQSIYTRVYVNEKAFGYFVLQEEAASESFVRSAFHGDGKGNYLITDINKLGHPLECSTGADFYYTGNTFYSFQPYNETRYDNSRVKELCKQFENLDINSVSQIKTFGQKYFDIDTFFKAIAMQILTGHWDSYWLYSTNFALYDDPTENNKFYFICQDWDGTFGLNLGMPYMRYDDFVKRSYKDFLNLEWGLDEYDSPYRYAIDKLLSNKSLQSLFEEILKIIVVEIFNPKSLNKRIDALVERHRDEVAWNYETISKHPMRTTSYDQLNWTIDDFDTNINTSSKHGASYGLKEWIYRRAKAMNEEFGLDIDLGTETYGSDISRNGKCGPEDGKCPKGQCCSIYGYCGTGEYCSKCQPEFGYCPETVDIIKTTSIKKTTSTTVKKTTTTVKKTTTTIIKVTNTKASSSTSEIKISYDGTCGVGKGRCPEGLCCSKYGYCGKTEKHCENGCQSEFGICNGIAPTPISKTKTETVIDYTKIYSGDSTCGDGKGRCEDGLCCSQYGYCGTSSAHCGNKCQALYGICN